MLQMNYFLSFDNKLFYYLLIYYYTSGSGVVMEFMTLGNVGAFHLLLKKKQNSLFHLGSVQRSMSRGTQLWYNVTQTCHIFRNVPSQIISNHNLHLGGSKHPQKHVCWECFESENWSNFRETSAKIGVELCHTESGSWAQRPDWHQDISLLLLTKAFTSSCLKGCVIIWYCVWNLMQHIY